MPCPYFEPTSVAVQPRSAYARMPLIEEYDGHCHISGQPVTTSSEMRFAGCNQGRTHIGCHFFPATGARLPIRRFTVTEQSSSALTILVTEEVDHSPVRWFPVRYSALTGEIDKPAVDPCEREQIRAFCKSYLLRFPK